MDTQDRLIVDKAGKQEIFYLDHIIENSILFTFKEFEKVTLEMICSEDNYISFEYPNDDELKELHNNQYLILNDYEYERDSADNNTFYPSKYYMSIHYNNRIVECYFNVESNALGNNIYDIRKIVNDFSKGLELDLFRNNSGKESVDTNEGYYIPLYDKIANNEKMLLFEIDYILKHPIENIEKEFKLTKKPVKETKKKIKYDIKKSIYNYSGRKSIEERKVVSIKNRENYSLKKSIDKIFDACTNINKQFEITIEKLGKLLDSEKCGLEEIIKKKNTLNVRRHDQKYQKRIYAEYNQLYDSIYNHQFEIDNLLEKKNSINKIRNRFLSIITESWLNELDVINNSCVFNDFVNNVHYKKIIDFAKQFNVNFDDKTYEKGKYAYKKTSKLYEIYVLILIFKTLEKNGFIFEIDGNYDYNFLFENQEYKFKKENNLIRVLYDKTVKGTDENPRDELSNQNSTSNRPDIVIMFYEENIIKNCIILEVKCRRKNNIYVNSGDTPVFSQLKDYTNFWYFDKNGKLDKNILKKVYAIYPQEEASKLNLNANQICLLSLNPIYDYENDESYINFYNEIMSYI